MMCRLHPMKRSSRLRVTKDTLEELKKSISLHFTSRFWKIQSGSERKGWSLGIFNELRSQSGVVYVADLESYLCHHGIQCTVNQLCQLLSSHIESSHFITFDEFDAFAKHLKNVDDFHIVNAFPKTFGVSTRIESSGKQEESDVAAGSCMRRTHAVSSNLCQLPAYYSLLNMSWWDSWL